jgi:putative transcriptional regulator
VLGADTAPDDVEQRTHRLRAFAGHAGWASGQLDAEIDREDWFVAPATAEHVFSDDPESLWSLVLSELGGQYELLARMPEDPSVN